MIVLLSPAKSLNADPVRVRHETHPRFLEKSATLVEILKQKSPENLKSLMSISDDLAQLNHARYQNFTLPFTSENAKAALLAFQGDVYRGLQAGDFDGWDLRFAQKHIRILSGLYGLLRPLDLIQPYRLEMGTRLKNPEGKDLYTFWGDLITDQLNADAEEAKTRTIINLASNEYFKAVNKKKLRGSVYDIRFLEQRNGKFKFISFTAKQARGWMTRYIVQNRITRPGHLKGFMEEGFTFNAAMSSEHAFTFTR